MKRHQREELYRAIKFIFEPMTKKKDPAAVSLGRKGGKAGTGKAKARTPEQCRKAAKARWAKHRKPSKLSL